EYKETYKHEPEYKETYKHEPEYNKPVHDYKPQHYQSFL
ncbi:unnamed protein product, partial [Soboliphyme baturini]|uniref:HMG box domain-containing protein n=1 Tax=Soboliphyme baturini TaxID=241478 RepID=A0A183J3K7_9BILA